MVDIRVTFEDQKVFFPPLRRWERKLTRWSYIQD